MTATPPEDSDHHQTDTAHGQTNVSSGPSQASSLPNHLTYGVYWRSRAGELVEGGDVEPSMHWHTEYVRLRPILLRPSST